MLVFLVFAGMALPVIWRMRGLSILRSALSHEPLYMRVAAFAFFAATVIYGGGKGELRSENGEWKNENGEWKSENGELRTTPQIFNFQFSILNSSSYAVLSNLCFTSIAATPTNVALGIGWIALTNTSGQLDIYAKTNLVERLWRHLAEMDVDAADGEATAEVPLEWLDNPPRAFFNLGDRLDTDGDGLPDAFEHLAIGSSPSLIDTDGDGLDDFTEYLAGLDPSAEPPEFVAQSDTLAALELIPAFYAEFPATFTCSNVWQRTIHVEPLTGLRQYFLSGSPEGTMPLNLCGMALEWDDGTVQGTVPTNTAAFPLPLDAYRDCDLTLTLRRDGDAVLMDSPLYLLASVPRTTVNAAATAVANGVTYYATDFSATRHVDIEVDCSETPGTNRTVRSVFDSLSDFLMQSDIEVGLPDEGLGESLDSETCVLPLTVSSLGVHPLPSPVEAVPVRAGARPFPETPPRTDDSGPGPSAILAIAPFIEWSSNHDASYGGDALAFDLATGTYSNTCEYPLNSGCIWTEWFRSASGEFECTCTASVNLGDGDVPPGITTSIEQTDYGATGRVMLGGTEIWSGGSSHSRYQSWSGGESGTTLLSSPDSGECGDPCGSCEGGSCDDLENPDIGSLRFRIPLSVPLDGHVDGFLFLNEDFTFWPTPGYFNIKTRHDADVEIVRRHGSISMVRSNGARGRQINIEGISRGVRLTVTNLFEGVGGKLDHIWEITQTNGMMRLRKISRAGNLMQDESFALGGPEGETTRIDNISGRIETVSRQGAFTEDPESEVFERRTVSDASGTVFEETETLLRRFGEGRSAVERETMRRSMTPLATNETFAIYWPDGKPMFSWGDDRPCRYTAFDGLGRETNSISYFCDRDTLEDFGIYSGEGHSFFQSFPFDVFQTVTSYEPLTGDDADPRDRDEPRRIDEYRTDADGEPVLVARTWFVHARGLEQGWQTHTATAIRAASQNASMDDQANAVSVSTDIDADAPGTPRVLRGKSIMEQDGDGAVTHRVWSPCAFSLESGIPAFASGDTHWLCVSAEEFGEETRPVAQITVIDADTGSEVYSARRHVDSGIDFGWEAHLYDCRDRRVATLYADGASSTNAYSCCRLLWTQGSDGAKTLRSATTGKDSLYYAMEEVSLAQLPHDDNPGSQMLPYEVQGPSEANSAYRVTQRFMDAFGRETNTVVRTCRNPGAATNENWTCAGWRASSSVAYPFGTSDYRVATDQRGGEVTEIVSRQPTADLAQTIASNKTTTATSYRNGDSATFEEWADVATMPPSSSRWRETRRFAEYAADGTSAEYVVVSSSDGDCTTNSIIFHDFLGRTVRAITPSSDTTYAYDGATARLLSSSDAISGIATTNLYDDLGEQVGQIVSGVETRTETGYEVVSNILWRVTAQTIFTSNSNSNSLTPPLTNSSTVARERLTGLSDQLRSERLTFHNGEPVSHSQSSFDAETLILTEVTESATSGTNTVKRKFGRLIETIDSTGRTRHFFDPYGRAFFKTLNNRRVDAYGRNDCGDIEEYAVFRAKVDWLSDLHAYDIFGNRVATTNALGDTTFFAYDAANRLVATGGAAYPALYAYDAHGRRTGLSTTRDGVSWDTTTWAYAPRTGNCVSKTYADGSTVAYTYTPDGKPLRTTYPSGRWKENAYDNSRRLIATEYSDGETNGFAYDAFGQRIAESNSVASTVYLRDNCGNCTNETIVLAGEPQSPAVASTNTIERAYDSYGRLVQDSLCGFAPPREISYSSDGLIAAISNAEAVVEYSYTSDRLDAGYTLTLTNGTTFTRTIVRDAYRRNL
ncbi:MAG: RHS repeat protein, partial [Kiritimatiellae bacterium]|nr:RHS repeat protein [Kiritimatiellia bacterium]